MEGSGTSESRPEVAVPPGWRPHTIVGLFRVVWGFGSVCWEGAGDGRSGTRAQGTGGPPAHPTCVCEGGRGGECLPVWGFPVHQKGSMALGAPGCGALSIRRQVQCRPRRAPCKRGAASFGCYGPSLRPFHWEDLCRIKRGYIGCDGPPSGGPVPG